MPELYLGTDPEFFLFDNGRRKLKSAIGVVNGTKTDKIDLGNGNKLFYDNVLAEVNVKPGKSALEFSNNISVCLRSLAKAVRPYQLLLQASATFPESECTHPDAKVFGCDPEFDAYELGVVQAPECTSTFRSAGGHIHLGYVEEGWPLLASVAEDEGIARAWGRLWVVRMLDLFLGIPSLWMDQDPNSPVRRKLYGKAGYHRPTNPDPGPDYGVEYRATSNFWLRSPEMVQLIYDICKFTVDFVGENKHKELWKVNEADQSESTCNYDVKALCSAINNSDKKAASKFLNEYVKKYMPAALYSRILNASEPYKLEFYKSWNMSEK